MFSNKEYILHCIRVLLPEYPKPPMQFAPSGHADHESFLE